MAAVDGGHIARVVEEVGADGAQRTDRHDDWIQGAQVAKKNATSLNRSVPPRLTSNLAPLRDFRGRTGSGNTRLGGGA